MNFLLGLSILCGLQTIIAHRGASGTLPEHTLEAFSEAIQQGADIIEADVVATKDGELIVRHENELSRTTNVADLFPDRRTTKVIDGEIVEGWFSEDFSWAEIQRLRARQAMPFRDQSFNDKWAIPRLKDFLRLAKERQVGVYIETKHPSYFRSIGLPLEDGILEALLEAGFDQSPERVYLQSFEVNNLKEFRSKSSYKIVQLLGPLSERPFDQPLRTYGRMMTEMGFEEISSYAHGIGPWKELIYQSNLWRDLERLGLFSWLVAGWADTRKGPSRLVAWALSAGLEVHPWTFRDESRFMAARHNGQAEREYFDFLKTGITGLFTDFPASALRAKDAWCQKQKASSAVENSLSFCKDESRD